MEAQQDELAARHQDAPDNELVRHYATYILLMLAATAWSGVFAYHGCIVLLSGYLHHADLVGMLWDGFWKFLWLSAPLWVAGQTHPGGGAYSAKWLTWLGVLVSAACLFFDEGQQQQAMFGAGLPFLWMAAYFRWWYKPLVRRRRDPFRDFS